MRNLNCALLTTRQAKDLKESLANVNLEDLTEVLIQGNNGYPIQQTQTGQKSELWETLKDYYTGQDAYRDTVVARAYLYSDDFMEKFGDWRNPATTSVILDSQQEPKIYWIANINSSQHPITEGQQNKKIILAESQEAALLTYRYNQLQNPTQSDYDFFKMGLAMIELEQLIDQNNIANVSKKTYDSFTMRVTDKVSYEQLQAMPKQDREVYLYGMFQVLGDWWYRHANINLLPSPDPFTNNSFAFPVIVGNLKTTNPISLETGLQASLQQLGEYSYKGEFGLVYTSNSDNIYKLPIKKTQTLLTRSFNTSADNELENSVYSNAQKKLYQALLGKTRLTYNQVYHKLSANSSIKKALNSFLSEDPDFVQYLKNDKNKATLFYKEFMRTLGKIYNFSEDNTQQNLKFKLNVAKQITRAFARPKTFFQIRHFLLVQERLRTKFSRMMPMPVKGRDNALFVQDPTTKNVFQVVPQKGQKPTYIYTELTPDEKKSLNGIQLNLQFDLALSEAAPERVIKYLGSLDAVYERINTLFPTETVPAKDVLTSLINLSSPFVEIIHQLQKNKGLADIPIQLVNELYDNNGKPADGVFDPRTRTIQINRNATKLIDKVIVHELIHAATWDIIVGKTQLAQTGRDIYNEALKLVLEKYQVSSYEELIQIKPSLYGLKNELEFYAELYTSAGFIRELNTLGEMDDEPISIWSRIKNFLLNVIGLKQTSKLYKRASIHLDEILDQSMTRVNTQLDEDALAYWESLGETMASASYSDIEIVTADDLDLYGDIRQGLNIATKSKYSPKKAQTTQQYHMHSGGAYGSDFYWGAIGAQYGVIPHHYYYDVEGYELPPYRNELILEEDINEGKIQAALAGHRTFGYDKPVVKNPLLIRNWAQVKYADAIFAIGVLANEGDLYSDKDKENPRHFLRQMVKGGTGWAVGMAINEGKPVYVFDQEQKQWFSYNAILGAFLPLYDTPVLTPNFAGIGTRELNDAGRKAIRDIYTKTFGTEPQTTPNSLTIVPLDKVYSEAARIGGIPTTRPPKGADQLHHFGNPFTHYKNHPNTVTVKDVRTAVIAFDAWISGKNAWLFKWDPADNFYDIAFGEEIPFEAIGGSPIHISEIQPERRDWIIQQIESGELRGKPVVYYTETIPDNSYGRATYDVVEAPNHAHILQKYINKPNEKPTVQIFQGFWTRADVESRQDAIFLFGDNTEDRQSGYTPASTQAVIRGLENAIGIDTKKNRFTDINSYFTDTDFDIFKSQVDEAIQTAINSGKTIVLPADGIGTGKAELAIRAPRLFAYLQQKLQDLKDGKIQRTEQPKASLTSFNKQENSDTYVKEVLDVAKRGINTPTEFFTENEREIIKTKVGGNLKVASVSRHTDPVFFTEKVIEAWKDNITKYPFGDPKRFYATEIWTKHDGLPLVDLLQACKEYRIAPMISFSITSLGGTAYEPGVMKASDLLDRIEDLIGQGLINPQTTTIRIDPIVPGVTQESDVEAIITRCQSLGITNFVSSIMQSYGYLEGTAKDRGVISALRNIGYNWDAHYARKADGKLAHVANLATGQKWGGFLKSMMQKYNVSIKSCSSNNLGLQAAACLDPDIINLVTGTEVDRSNVTSERKECQCYGNKADVLAYADNCLSACAYCYAAQQDNNPFTYYNEDGTLKDNEYTQTQRVEAERQEQQIIDVFLTVEGLNITKEQRQHLNNIYNCSTVVMSQKTDRGFGAIIEKFAKYISKSIVFVNDLVTDPDVLQQIDLNGSVFIYGFNKSNIHKLYELLENYEVIVNHREVLSQAEVTQIDPEPSDKPLAIIEQESLQQEHQIQPVVQVLEQKQSKFQLKEGQEQAVQTVVHAAKKVKTNGKQIVTILGKAGTGKTTIVGEYLQRIQAEYGRPIRVICSATSHEATNLLFKKISAMVEDNLNIIVTKYTVAALLGKKPDGKGGFKVDPESWDDKYGKIQSTDVIIWDECSMLPTADCKQIEEALQSLLIYTGDKGQLGPIEERVKDYLPPAFRRHLDEDGNIAPNGHIFELTERVRQTEGDPILDLAEPFWQSATGNDRKTQKTSLTRLMEAVEAEQINSTSALVRFELTDMHSIDMPKLTEFFAPYIQQSVDNEDYTLFHVIPYHKDTTIEMNQYFRAEALKHLLRTKNQETLVYTDIKTGNKVSLPIDQITSNNISEIPFQEGEMVYVPEPIGPNAEIHNGQYVKISTNWGRVLFPVKTATLDTVIPCQEIKVIWKIDKGYPETHTFLVPADFEQYRKIVRQVGNDAFGFGGTRAEKDLWKKLKNEFGQVTAPWALNVHKAQGQTYKAVYIPLADYKRAAWNKEIPVDSYARAAYTALTRASRCTFLGGKAASKTFEGIPVEDISLQYIENQIKQNAFNETTEETPVEDAIIATLPQTIEEVPTDAEVEIEDVVAEIIPTEDTGHWMYEDMQTQIAYDFINYVTGGDVLWNHAYDGDQNAQEQVTTLLTNWVQRQTELLKLGYRFKDPVQKSNGFDFSDVLEPDDLNMTISEGNIPTLAEQITDLTIEAAQVIKTNLYKNNYKLGRHTIDEVLADPNFFSKSQPFWESKVANTDLLVRRSDGTFNISICKTLDDARKLGYGEEIKIQTDGQYRLDVNGNRMYKLPTSKYAIYKNADGQEVLVLISQNIEQIKTDLTTVLQTVPDLVSVQPIVEQTNNAAVAKTMFEMASRFSYIGTFVPTYNNIVQNAKLTGDEKLDAVILKDLKTKAHQIIYGKNERGVPNRKQYQKDLSATLYHSFVRSLRNVDTRIPTQNLASIQGVEIVSFNTFGRNDIFINRWQMWLQGSDLDIDKTYGMGSSIKKNGMYDHWSPLAQYTSKELADLSDKLPAPTGKKLMLETNAKAYKYYSDDVMLIQVQQEADNKINQLFLQAANGKYVERFRTIVSLLRELTHVNHIVLSPEVVQHPNFNKVVNLLNRHNTHKPSKSALQNMVSHHIYEIVTDPRNMIQSHYPIDVALDEIVDAISDLESALQVSMYDGYSQYQMQEDALTGRAVVGVMANALKAFFNITQANNVYYNNPNTTLNPYDHHFGITTLTVGGKTYNIHSVANLRISADQWVEINAMAAELMGENVEILKTKKDVSIVLAAFTSLATDNAKLLGLSKLNANIHLASMLTYMASVGFDFSAIKALATSKPMQLLAKYLKQDSWQADHSGIDKNTWGFIGKQLKTKSEKDELSQLERLYYAAQELRDFTAVLGINQGLKNSLNDAAIFANKFSDMFKKQLDRLSIKFELIADDTQRQSIIRKIMKQRGVKNKEYERFLDDQITEVLPMVQKYGFNGNVDIQLYFTDPDYRKMVADSYNIIKSTFNSYALLEESPNFLAMVESCSKAIQKFTACAKGRFVIDQVKELFDPLIVQNTAVNPQGQEYEVFKKPWVINEQVLNMSQRFFDDYVISDFITSEVGPNFNFKMKIKDSEVIVGISSLHSAERYLNMISGVVLNTIKYSDIIKNIPEAQGFFKNIVLQIVNTDRGQDRRLVLRGNLNALRTSTSEADILKYNEIIAGFEAIKSLRMSQVLGEDYVGGADPTIGDMLFLYNLISNQGAEGRSNLDILFDGYMLEGLDLFTESEATDQANLEKLQTNLQFKLLQTYTQYDIGQKSVQTTKELFNYYLVRNRQARNKFKVQIGTKKDNKTMQNGSPLINLEHTKYSIDGHMIFEKFMSQLKSGNLIINIKCE